MKLKLHYLNLLAIFFTLPIIVMIAIEWDYFRLREAGVFIFLILIYGMGWDIWATRHGEKDRLWIWQYNPNTSTGLKILGHPIEQYLLGAAWFLWLLLFWELLQRILVMPIITELTAFIGVSLWMIIMSVFVYRKYRE